MITMKYIKGLFIIVLLSLFTVSCEDFSTDLNVPNLEHPNDDILTSDPVALTATAGSIIHNWFMAVHAYYGPGAAMQTMADISTCSWGNMGMKDLSSEPRVAFNNKSSYGNDVTNSYFNALYSVLSDANTIVAAVDKGTDFEDPDLVMTIGKFGQALSIGYLALVFDRVWLSDENGVVGEGAVSYKEAMVFALQKLDEAIALAKDKGVEVPDSWLPGGGGANTSFVQFLNSMGARMLVGNVRNKAQKAEIDWDKVIKYTSNGLQADFEIYMDDQSWYDLVPKTYLVYPGWARVDMRVVHMLDPNMPDYWTDDIVSLPEAHSDDARLETDYQYLSSNNFRPERGLYHFSNYRYARLDYYITEWTTNVVEYSKSENDMYMAEAYLNKGDVAQAAAIVNAGTRTTRGNLPPVDANFDDVKYAIHYERMVEFAYTGMGIGFFEMRKEDLLQKGTLLHFPIPGKALEAIPEDYYTYGGDQGVPGEDYSIGGWR